MKKIYSVQYLRGLAAVLVVVAHSYDYSLPSHDADALRLGILGVALFFVISGFIMVTISGNGSFSAREFLWRRFLRVAPLYWIFTTVIAAAAALLPQLFKTTQFTWPHYILSLAFIPHISPEGDGVSPILSLGWTLNYEVYFYVLFSLLAFLASGLRVVSLTLILALMFIIGMLFSVPAPWSFYTDKAPLAFCIGAWIGFAYSRGMIVQSSRSAKLAVFISLAFLIIAFSLSRNQRVDITIFLLLCMGSLAVLFAGLSCESRLVKSKFLELLGDASYSIYLVHMFVVGGVTSAGRRVLSDGFSSTLLVTAVSIFISIAMGLAAHSFLEKPLLSRLTRRRAKLGVAST